MSFIENWFSFIRSRDIYKAWSRIRPWNQFLAHMNLECSLLFGPIKWFLRYLFQIKVWRALLVQWAPWQRQEDAWDFQVECSSLNWALRRCITQTLLEVEGLCMSKSLNPFPINNDLIQMVYDVCMHHLFNNIWALHNYEIHLST